MGTFYSIKKKEKKLNYSNFDYVHFGWVRKKCKYNFSFATLKENVRKKKKKIDVITILTMLTLDISDKMQVLIFHS